MREGVVAVGFEADGIRLGVAVGGVLGQGDVARQNLTIHHKRIGTACFQQQEAFGMVFAKHFFEVNAIGTLMLAQQLHRGRSSGGCHVAAVQLGNRCDTRVGLNCNAHFFNISGQHK